MVRDTTRLADEHYDLAILGGGVNGLCAAWDAALRGLRVALVEKNDFGGASSAGTFHIVHGGFRYLQNLDLSRMRASIRERRWMLRAAPHLVRPLPFLIPCRGSGLRGPAAFFAALKAYDWIAIDRNRGVDPDRAIPPGRLLSRTEAATALGASAPRDMTGAAVFFDGVMMHSERLTQTFALAAHRAGARLANYAEASSLLVRNGRVCGVTVRDRIRGETFDIRAAAVLNMTGPWTGPFLSAAGAKPDLHSFRLCRGAQILVRKPLAREIAFAVELRDSDGRGRMLFLRPWREMTWIGTSEDPFDAPPDSFSVAGADIERLLADVNRAIPSAHLESGDVVAWNGGLRPIDPPTPHRPGLRISDRDRILIPSASDGLRGLVSAVGIKYTTCRRLAERAVDAAVAAGGLRAGPDRTAGERLPGADAESVAAFEARAVDGFETDMDTARRLAVHYGSEVDRLRTQGAAAGDWTPLPECAGVTRGEILHAVREEMAQTCADVVLRRTAMAAAGHPGRGAIDACARIMAPELGWSEERIAEETASVDRALTLR